MREIGALVTGLWRGYRASHCRQGSGYYEYAQTSHIWPQLHEAHEAPRHRTPSNRHTTNRIVDTQFTMSPKPRTTAPQTTTTSSSATVKSKSSGIDAQSILQGVWSNYMKKTPQRTKLLDTFMAFLVTVGALQFLYVVLVGNFVRPPSHSSFLSSPSWRSNSN